MNLFNESRMAIHTLLDFTAELASNGSRYSQRGFRCDIRTRSERSNFFQLHGILSLDSTI